MNKLIYEYLDSYIPNPKCELDYNRDYELLLATILSARCTDKRVNKVTKEFFKNYDIYGIANADIKSIENIIKSCGNYSKKSVYLIEVCKSLIKDYDGKVPNNRKYLETLPGVGRKTTNVVLKNLYNEPCIPVDTHVERVSKRLGLAKPSDTVKAVEKKLMKSIPKEKWNRVGEQLLLFGRYYCKSVNPKCDDCLMKKICKYQKNSSNCDVNPN